MLGIANPLFNLIIQKIYTNKSFTNFSENDLTIVKPYFTPGQLSAIKSFGSLSLNPLFTPTSSVSDEVQIQLNLTPATTLTTTISYSFSKGAMIIQAIDGTNNLLVPLYLNKLSGFKTIGLSLGGVIKNSYAHGYLPFNNLPASAAIASSAPATVISIANNIGTTIQNAFSSTDFSSYSSIPTLIQSIIQQGFWGSLQLTSLVKSIFIYIYNLAVNGLDSAKPFSYTPALNPLQNYLFPEKITLTATNKSYTIFYNSQQMVIQNIDGKNGSIAIPLVNIGFPSVQNITLAINSSLLKLAFIPPVTSTTTSITLDANTIAMIATSISGLFSSSQPAPTLCNKIVQAIPQNILNTINSSDYKTINPYVSIAQNSSWQQANSSTSTTSIAPNIGSFDMNTPSGVFTITYNSTSMIIQNIDRNGNSITLPFANINFTSLSTSQTIAQTIGNTITTAITSAFPLKGRTQKKARVNTPTPQAASTTTPPQGPFNVTSANTNATNIGTSFTTAILNLDLKLL